MRGGRARGARQGARRLRKCGAALALSLALGACAAGPPRPAWAPAELERAVLPLVVAWQAARPVIEARLDGQGPFLFAVDTGLAGAALSRPLAESLGLRPVGDPARGTQAVAVTLGLGALRLEGVRLAVVDLAELGRLDERPVAGILGSGVLAGRALELDVEGGALVLWRTPPPTPVGASEVALTPLGDGTFSAPVRFGETERAARVALGQPLCGLPPEDQAFKALPALQGMIRLAEVSLAGRQDACAVLPGPASVGFAVLGQHPLRLDAEGARLARWPAAGPPRHLARFADLPDCGPGLAGCLQGRVVVEGDRLYVALDPPAVALPDRYWLRVDVGLPDQPLGLLVRRGAAATGTVLADARLPYLPDRMRPPGAAVDVVDVVPLAQRCPGQVCLR